MGARGSAIGIRVAQAIPELFGLILISFLLTRALPGDPAAQLAGAMATPGSIEEGRRSLGLDQPPVTQVWLCLGQLAPGDPGQSVSSVQPVVEELASRHRSSSRSLRCWSPAPRRSRSAHWLGTDNLGRDVFSRVNVATRLELAISVAAVALGFVIGSVLGAVAGDRGGWIDSVLSRVLDTIMAFPLFVLAMGIVAALGNSVAIINIPFYACLVRAEVNIRREAGFTLAAKLACNSDTRVLAMHIFPNALPPMMVQVSLNLGWAILNAAWLSFIGLGVRPPTPEWGIMVAKGANDIVSGERWRALFPGLWVMLAVFTFNLMGDGLRDIVDPRRL